MADPRALPLRDGQDPHDALQPFTDGLPVVPPTPRRVAQMLEGTLRPHAEVLGVCPPNLVPVTVRDAAVQAVMAGCAAVHFTVVLAATEAMLSDEFNLHGKELGMVRGFSPLPSSLS